jgi:hypothetical protein
VKFEIVPPQGVRGIKFGSSIEKIRRQFGPGFQPFKRSLDNAVPSDYYPNLGLFAYYKKSGELEAVEFERPIHVMFDGMDLLKVSFNTVGLIFGAEIRSWRRTMTVLPRMRWNRRLGAGKAGASAQAM